MTDRRHGTSWCWMCVSQSLVPLHDECIQFTLRKGLSNHVLLYKDLHHTFLSPLTSHCKFHYVQKCHVRSIQKTHIALSGSYFPLTYAKLKF